MDTYFASFLPCISLFGWIFPLCAAWLDYRSLANGLGFNEWVKAQFSVVSVKYFGRIFTFSYFKFRLFRLDRHQIDTISNFRVISVHVNVLLQTYCYKFDWLMVKLIILDDSFWSIEWCLWSRVVNWNSFMVQRL